MIGTPALVTDGNGVAEGAVWDGPAAIVFGDGKRVGAIADRNGLRPTAFAVTRDRLVAVCSEAGAIPLPP